jgi:hypothetical protein
MKRGLLFILSMVLIQIALAQAMQNQSNKPSKQEMDSLIRNAAPYRGWFWVFNKFKQDTAFQTALQNNARLKEQFDSANKYYNKLLNKQFEVSSLFVANYGNIFIMLNNIKSLPTIFTLELVGATSLIYMTTQAKFLILYQAKFLKHTQAFIKIGGYSIDQSKWRVNFFDNTNYKQFKRKQERITRRLSQKGKLLYLLN